MTVVFTVGIGLPGGGFVLQMGKVHVMNGILCVSDK